MKGRIQSGLEDLLEKVQGPLMDRLFKVNSEEANLLRELETMIIKMMPVRKKASVEEMWQEIRCKREETDE